MKCLNGTCNGFSREESVLALHSVAHVTGIKEEKTAQMHSYFGDVVQLYHSYHIYYIRLVTVMSMSLSFLSKETD